MLLFLLLLPVCSGQVINGVVHYGIVVTYYPKEMNSTELTVVFRFKLNYGNCTAVDTSLCSSCDGSELGKVDDESSGEWCQREWIVTTFLRYDSFIFEFPRDNWTNNTVNGVMRSRIVGLIELRHRSDTGRANSSPQTTIVPVLRVPVNCQRDFNLLAFDPDGDEVKCRYGSTQLFECDPCSPPSALSISSSCSLSFTPTNTSIEGLYVVQLMMEDFPRQNIILTHFNGSIEIRTPNDTISKIPVQFVVDVDPAVPSCTEGLYLPRFLPPTPANGAHLFIPVNQTLEISIKAEANISTISELLLSAPYNVSETASGSGQYTLTWTPPEKEDGQSLPICFVVQAVHNSTKYHSELRCVVVSVGNDPPETTPPPNTTTPPETAPPPATTTPSATTTPPETTTPPATTTPPETTPPPATTTPSATTTPPNTTTPPETTTLPPETTPGPEQIVLRLTVRTSSLFPLSEDTKTSIISELRDELIRRGLPSNFTLVYQDQVEPSATPPPAGLN